MTDFGILAPGWAGTGVDELVSDLAWVQAMLDAEAALACAQAELGVIPAEAARVIVAACSAERLDPRGLAAGVHATANPVVALVAQLTAVVESMDDYAVDYVHRGSTSQDILDSAMMLVTSRVFDRIVTELRSCAEGMAELARQHRRTPMAGRTLTQHAVPITFGLKASVWLKLVLDTIERVERVVLPASLGGAAGTLSAYGEYAAQAGVRGGIELIEPFARHLGLEPSVPWHSIRTPIADIAGALVFVAGALGKFALDVQVLTRTEIGEVAEPSAPGRGASSAMPQKHNPVYSTLIMTAARQIPAYALVLYQSMVVEDERSAGGWHAEWQPLREILRLAAGAATNAASLASGLRVQPEVMRDNLHLTGSAVVSEKLGAVLAPLLGKAPAKKLLTRLIEESAATGADLVDLLASELPQLDPAAVRDLLDPAQYVGDAPALTDLVLRNHIS